MTPMSGATPATVLGPAVATLGTYLAAVLGVVVVAAVALVAVVRGWRLLGEIVTGSDYGGYDESAIAEATGTGNDYDETKDPDYRAPWDDGSFG
jgi:hypothetical protein